MKISLRWLTLFCLASCIFFTMQRFVFAGDDLSERKTQALVLLENMQLAKTFEAIIPNMMQQQAPLIKKAYPETTDKDIEDFITFAVPKFTQELSGLKLEMATLYADNFTLSQLKDLSVFYGSESGQVFLAKQPLMTAEGFKIGAAWGQALMEKAGPEFEAFKKRKE
jgi:hypothetical protein